MEITNSEKRCGMVSIVGRPNVGKSTLLNHLLDEKISIVSPVPQTTRNQIRGIYNDERGQIVFIDTPGFHKGRDRLDDWMNHASTQTFQEADCLVYLMDVSRKVGEEEQVIVKKLRGVKNPIIVGFNKVDQKRNNIPEYIALIEKVFGKPIPDIPNIMLIAISGEQGINTDKLLELIYERIPVGPALYPEDIICDIPQRMAVADIIREKFFLLTREELPHSIGVVIEAIEPQSKKIIHIRAMVLVERDSQKEIVIGYRGEMLKKVGTAARAELEVLLGSKIYLELIVKAEKDWRISPHRLLECGYFGE